MAFGFLGKAVRSVGKSISSGISSAANQIGKVPVVGGGLKGVFTLATSPIKLTGTVASGARLDKAVIGHFKDELGAAKEVAPYVQTVVSFVPGIGTAASGAIGAGLALAQGQPLTKALVAGVKGALPGGAATQAAFSVAEAAMNGKPIAEIGLSAIPGMNDTQKKALLAVINISKDVASGKNVADTVYKNALNQLPAEAQKAVTIGIAVGRGQNLQKTLIKNLKLDDVKMLGSIGGKVIPTNAILTAGLKALPDKKVATGFKVAQGLMNNPKIKPIDIMAVRKKLHPPQKKGFDIGMAARIGMANVKIPKTVSTPTQQFGYLATRGVSGQTPKNKAAMVKAIITTPEAKKGAIKAVASVQHIIWWRKILHSIGIAA